ncbi:hypothetical protein, partial [Paraburkholderia sp. SIMBA_054]|uniref:hypothetical protein n=1 Tax=Paraburkholderia sp. SIMBA_054 TaxID=3085795 RepID=UPI00397B8B39
LMGIVYSNNIGLDALKKKIDAKLAGEEDQPEPPAADAVFAPNPLAGQNEPAKRKTLRQHLHDTQMRLIRCRITNMDPKKKDLPGEIFTVANEHLGTVRKYVPYGEVTDDGYHLPYCIYRQLESRKFLNIRTTKGKNGVPRIEQRWAKEFSLEVLPQLTEAELKRLATAQIAAGAVGVGADDAL